MVRSRSRRRLRRDLPAGVVSLGFITAGGATATGAPPRLTTGLPGAALTDDTAPEFHGVPFTHTWIYGSYDGEITFYEVMIATKWFDDLCTGAVADRCVAFKQPQAWKIAGRYPATYCMEYRENRGDYVVSMSDWGYRNAS